MRLYAPIRGSTSALFSSQPPTQRAENPLPTSGRVAPVNLRLSVASAEVSETRFRRRSGHRDERLSRVRGQVGEGQDDPVGNDLRMPIRWVDVQPQPVKVVVAFTGSRRPVAQARVRR